MELTPLVAQSRRHIAHAQWLVESGRGHACGNVPDRVAVQVMDQVAAPGYAALNQFKADQLALHPRRLNLAQGGAADEVALIELDDPA